MAETLEGNELTRRIMAVCTGCGHFKWEGYKGFCNRKSTPCHSSRVRRWLAELEKLEAPVCVAHREKGKGGHNEAGTTNRPR